MSSGGDSQPAVAVAARAYEVMATSRAIDDACAALVAAGEPVPNYHSGRGQEAMSTAIGLALEPDDYLLYTYRDFGALLAKGVPLDALVADLLLKEAGTTKGYGGIMHVVAPERGIVGRNGVFGSRFGIAVGLAIGAVAQGEERVVLCAYGEAEGGRGPLYEALNFACLRSLPIVFFAQHNGFSISTRTEELYAGGDMSTMWRGMPLPVHAVDGNSFFDVYDTTRIAVDAARSGLGPSLVEAVTYRIDAHIPAEAEVFGRHDYRSEAEIRAWREKDPIARLRASLVEDGLLDSDELDAGDAATSERVKSAFAVGRSLLGPEPSTIECFVYYESNGGAA